jgi:magnesium transporter
MKGAKTTALNHDLARELIRAGAQDRVLRLVGKTHPADIALLFTGLGSTEIRFLFDLLYSIRRADKTLKELPHDLLPDILACIEDEKVARVISRADPDDAVTFIDALPEERRERVLTLVEPEGKEKLRKLISYPEGTVGRIMTTDYLSLPPDTTAQGAIDKIRERGELETFFYLYVTDRDGKLTGVVPIRNLVVAPPDRWLGDLMIPEPVRADAHMDPEEASRLVSKYELLALPIVNNEGQLVGIITMDDVIDIINKETTEDMYKLAGLEEEDRVFTPAGRSIKMRLPWTVLNLVTASLAASVIGLFEGTLDKLVALATFFPIVAAVGGNAGIQTLTIIIRGIALGELEFSSAWRAVLKQVWINAAIGAVAGGVVTVLIVYIWEGNPLIGAILAAALIVNMGIVAGLSGTLVPLTLKWLQFDPAVGSGIIVTALTDFFGYFTFLYLATSFLHYLT